MPAALESQRCKEKSLKRIYMNKAFHREQQSLACPKSEEKDCSVVVVLVLLPD